MMRPNVSIGEATAEIGQSSYMVRPSFAALSRLGGPDDIDFTIRCCVAAYDSLCANKTPRVLDLASCCSMLVACSDIPSDLMGWCEPTKDDRLLWRQRMVSVNDLVVMANHCVKWGIMGDPAPRRKMTKKKREKAAGLFNPQEFVAIMVDEFGMSRADAWDTTMTEFQRLCEARERKNWGDRPEPPTKEEAQQAAKWAREVTRRAAECGVKQERGKSKRRVTGG